MIIYFMLIVLIVYLGGKQIQICFILFVAEVGFEPIIVCILIVPPTFIPCWLDSALQLHATACSVGGDNDTHKVWCE